ncbi:Nab6p NDAI_0E00270 [Naumovozyma dairenensis CBS 421]|uniref:RRM domain-containing protein n=1 Tax=Naumovozyma dairenensis (strain ATCC 10597 / BCRC 20456 / CBS 421 / NBRC 0211 / NRRL Y-12639) TaxID=1071378 RepID=G0WAS3_NAUDC|nr:hypothetical protein NDAI_0E00270 [Naumovozyma dairenensis CBS 421]CCD24843.1 hypothetical protein NDAI_0E00270 [Naumovozyma dairenensis CBS 421]
MKSYQQQQQENPYPRYNKSFSRRGSSYYMNVQQDQRSRKPSYISLNHSVHNPNMVYQHDPNGSQYFATTQQAYYIPSPLPNAPPTPFDTAYGATLLPSHLLMGSPYVSTPNGIVPSSQQQSQMFLYSQSPAGTPNRKSFSQLNSMLNQPSSRSNFFTDSYNNRYQNNPQTRIPEVDPNELFQKPFVISYKLLPTGDDAYRTRSLLFSNVASSIDLHSFIYDFVQYSSIESIYLISNTDDEKDQDNENDKNKRSILLSFLSREICLSFYNNVLQRLNEFKTNLQSKSLTLNFVILNYLEKTDDGSTANISNNQLNQIQENENDVNTNEFDYRNSMNTVNALKFDLINPDATRFIMIELKTKCDKETLLNKHLSFLIDNKKNIRYILESIDLFNIIENENSSENKSIIEAKNENENSPQGKEKDTMVQKRKRNRSKRTFPNHYAVLSFINIYMAMELRDYLKLNGLKHGITNASYVQIKHVKKSLNSSSKRSSVTSTTDNKDKSEVDTNESVEGKDKKSEEAKSFNNKLSSITMSSPDTTYEGEDDIDIDIIISKLQKLKLKETIQVLDIATYNTPLFQSHDSHMANITLSIVNPFEAQLMRPPPSNIVSPDQNHENLSYPILPPTLPSIEKFPTRDQTLNQETSGRRSLSSSSTSLSNYQGRSNSNNYNTEAKEVKEQNKGERNEGIFFVEQPTFNTDPTMYPIVRTLEDKFNTSAQVASSMGVEMGNRTIYIGNLNPRSKAEDVCNVVRGGILQSIKLIASKRICFVTFIEASAAVQFYANSFIDPLILHGNTLKIGWGNYYEPLSKSIALAVTIGASRNVYVSLPEFAFKDKFLNDPEYKEFHEKYKLPSEQQLRFDFNKYGPIEQINYLSDSHCCWVNFMNITSAIKLVEDVNNNPKDNTFSKKFNHRYDGLIINYGKDRCGNVNRNLISNKNSRHYRKVKKFSDNYKLRQLQEKRRVEQEKGKELNGGVNDNKLPSLDALGIGLQRTAPPEEQKVPESNEDDANYDSAVTESDTNTFNALGFRIQSNTDSHDDEQNDEKGEEQEEVDVIAHADDISSVNSSDVEIIIDCPHNESDTSMIQEKKKTIRKNQQKIDRLAKARNAMFPEHRETIPDINNKLFHDRKNKDKNRRKQVQGGIQDQDPHLSSTGKQQRVIPGADVMAQYLTQLQHSTFMYAANILGVSAEDNTYYDEEDTT